MVGRRKTRLWSLRVVLLVLAVGGLPACLGPGSESEAGPANATPNDPNPPIWGEKLDYSPLMGGVPDSSTPSWTLLYGPRTDWMKEFLFRDGQDSGPGYDGAGSKDWFQTWSSTNVTSGPVLNGIPTLALTAGDVSGSPAVRMNSEISISDRTFRGGTFSAWVYIPPAESVGASQFRRGVVSTLVLYWPGNQANDKVNEIDIEIACPRNSSIPAMIVSTAADTGGDSDSVLYHELDTAWLGAFAKLEIVWDSTGRNVQFFLNDTPVRHRGSWWHVPTADARLLLQHWIATNGFVSGWDASKGSSMFEVVAVRYPADPTPKIAVASGSVLATETRSNIQLKNVVNRNGGIAVGQADFSVYDAGTDQIRVDLRLWSEGVAQLATVDIEKRLPSDPDSRIVTGVWPGPLRIGPSVTAATPASFVVQFLEDGTTTFDVYVTPLGATKEWIGSFDLKAD